MRWVLSPPFSRRSSHLIHAWSGTFLLFWAVSIISFLALSLFLSLSLSLSLASVFLLSASMDSGNSGSLQSSSAGEEEYDSRQESFSVFLNPSPHVGPISNPPSQPQPPQSLFDSFSNYVDPFPRSPTNVNSLNLDTIWSKPPRSDGPNCTDITSLMSSNSSAIPQLSGMNPSIPIPSDNSLRRPAPAATDQPVRNSKKRSRASRRAPTTVLTTDTSNFRAMVQEFTGIPAPPFSASPFPRTRLDLFNAASSLRSGLSDPAPPPYLLRPFAQKVQFPHSTCSSTMVDGITSSITVTTNTSSNSTSATNTFPHQNLLNMQNPIFNFQSLLQNPPQAPKYPLSNLATFSAKSQPLVSSTQESHLKMGVLDDFTMNQGPVNVNTHLSMPPNLIASSRSDNNWGDGAGSSDGGHAHLRSTFNGSFNNSQRVNSCKMNFTATSSDFHAEKGAENVAPRGEGMVDSWICSSD